MNSWAITRWVGAIAALVAAAVLVALGAGPDRWQLYRPVVAISLGAAIFGGVASVQGLHLRRPKTAQPLWFMLPFTVAALAGIFGLLAAGAAWGIEYYFGDLAPPWGAVLMAIPALILWSAVLFGQLQQLRIDRAAGRLDAGPAPEIAADLANHAANWEAGVRLQAADTLYWGGYPGHVLDVLADLETIDDRLVTRRQALRAAARLRQGDVDRARAALDELTEIARRDQKRLALVRAELALAEGDPSTALAILNRPTRKPPHDDRPLLARREQLLRARAHADDGDSEAALAILRKADDGARREAANGDGPLAKLATELIHGGAAPFR